MSLPAPEVQGLRVSAAVTIPASEIEFRASRSSGPGGQHVNTSSTRVELTWNVVRSAALTDDQRARILLKLQSKIDGDGTLRIVVSDTRSQKQNRAIAEERLAATVHHGLLVRKPRKKTKPGRAAV
ncbi:aminoacyl-tRNA hydrolase, partial [bacterium]|nr:aminoacyl-tRNA hydrolase [bacterium]